MRLLGFSSSSGCGDYSAGAPPLPFFDSPTRLVLIAAGVDAEYMLGAAIGNGVLQGALVVLLASVGLAYLRLARGCWPSKCRLCLSAHVLDAVQFFVGMLATPTTTHSIVAAMRRQGGAGWLALGVMVGCGTTAVWMTLLSVVYWGRPKAFEHFEGCSDTKKKRISPWAVGRCLSHYFLAEEGEWLLLEGATPEEEERLGLVASVDFRLHGSSAVVRAGPSVDASGAGSSRHCGRSDRRPAAIVCGVRRAHLRRSRRLLVAVCVVSTLSDPFELSCQRGHRAVAVCGLALRYGVGDRWSRPSCVVAAAGDGHAHVADAVERVLRSHVCAAAGRVAGTATENCDGRREALDAPPEEELLELLCRPMSQPPPPPAPDRCEL